MGQGRRRVAGVESLAAAGEVASGAMLGNPVEEIRVRSDMMFYSM